MEVDAPDAFGVINDAGVRLHILSAPHAWISDPSTALAAVCAVDIWKTTPFVALLLLAGLQVIPNDLYEAAEVDGANQLQQFWKITLPLLAPAILVTLIFRTLDALRVFDVFYVFFGNRLGTQTMAIYAPEHDRQRRLRRLRRCGQHRHLPDHLAVRRHLPDVPAGDGPDERRQPRPRGQLVRPISRSRAFWRSPLGRILKRAPFYALVVIVFVYALFPFFWALR